MDGLEGLSGLRKLYIEKNRISRLEGLTESRNLEELYLSQQDTLVDFTFDEYSLAAIAGSLKYLDLSEAKVVYSQPLYYLEKLEVLILKKNFIADFEEQICPMLQTMNGLRQLDLSDNPVTSIPKYRDQVIIMTGARLQDIDNKKVTP
jgi:Leucine-rich repeat (LRR) protein